MKHRITCLLLSLFSLGVWAQSAPQKAPAKNTSKKAPIKKPAISTAAAAGIAAAAALTLEERNLIPDIHTGLMACDLDTFVTISPDEKTPGLFRVQGKGFDYYMTPVVTSTGAVRLEDRHAGALWLQIPSKSMLMNQKLGKRMADGCQSEQQVQFAAADKEQPPPDLLAEPVTTPDLPHLENSTAPLAGENNHVRKLP